MSPMITIQSHLARSGGLVVGSKYCMECRILCFSTIRSMLSDLWIWLVGVLLEKRNELGLGMVGSMI